MMIDLYLALGFGVAIICIMAWAKFESWRGDKAEEHAKSAQEAAKQANSTIELNRRDTDKQNELIEKQVKAAKLWADAHRLDDEI